MQRTLTRAIAAAAAIGFATAAHAIEIFVPEDHPTIQQAIDASSNGDVITVAAGTYFEAIDFNGRRITLRSADGPFETIIDATGQSAPVVTMENGENNLAVLEGFTLTGGTGTDGSSRVGGGMYLSQTNPIVRYCIIHGNTADSGGAIFTTSRFGPRFLNCLIYGNSAPTGGAVTAPEFAGVSFLNCTIVDNSAVSSFGGGLGGGAIWNGPSTAVQLSNSIVYGNVPDTYAGPDVPIVRFSNFEGGAPGMQSSIDANPQFVDAANRDYRLLSTSPCVDAGDSPAAAEVLVGDLDGGIRAVNDPDRPDNGVAVFGLVIDMGAFERQAAVAPPDDCPADLDDDGVIGFTDIVEILVGWGPCP